MKCLNTEINSYLIVKFSATMKTGTAQYRAIVFFSHICQFNQMINTYFAYMNVLSINKVFTCLYN